MSVYYADYHHHQTAGMSSRATGESWIANAAASRAPVDASPILTPLNELTPSSGHHQNSQHFPQSNLDSTFPFFMPHQFYPHHTTDSYPAPSGKSFSSCSLGSSTASSAAAQHAVVTPYSSTLFDPCKPNDLSSSYLTFKATDYHKQDLDASAADREIRDLSAVRCNKEQDGEKMAFYPWMKSISPTSGEDISYHFTLHFNKNHFHGNG